MNKNKKQNFNIVENRNDENNMNLININEEMKHAKEKQEHPHKVKVIKRYRLKVAKKPEQKNTVAIRDVNFGSS
jgi:hypothetical protein